MNADHSKPNAVSRLRASRSPRKPSRLARRLWIAITTVAAAGIAFAPNRPTRGAFLALLVIVAIGGAIAWLAGAGTRLSDSGREMGDD